MQSYSTSADEEGRGVPAGGAGHGGSGILARWAVLIACLCISPCAHALPTPDMLISFANAVPLITGAAVSVVGGIYFALRRALGRRASDLLIGGLFGLFIVLAGGLALLGYSWNETRKAEHVSSLAMYLRCDVSAHEAYVRFNSNNVNATINWRQYGNFRKIPFSAVAAQLASQPSAALIATYRRGIEYHSGVPVVQINGRQQPFAYVRPRELPRHLAESVDTRDLYLVDFERYYGRAPEKYLANKEVFKKFENVYIVSDVTEQDRYVRAPGGMWRQADSSQSAIDWPVRDEEWIVDEARVAFPGITRLLPDDEVSALLKQPDVYLVAPYDSFSRSAYVQDRSYLEPLLEGIDPERIISLDMNNPWTSVQLDELAARLDGARFLVIGITKYDWLYSGLDVAFEMWERFGHDPQRFRLAGFTTRLPEVIAARWEADRRQGVTDFLWQPFWDSVAWLKERWGWSTGASIIAFGAALRLLFFPIGMLEARSRMLRVRVRQSAQAGPLWRGAAPVLLRRLGVRGRWELLGTLLTLLLILPAYKLLSVLPPAYDGEGFLWLGRLAEPDVWLSLLVGALIYAKMRLGAVSARRWPTVLIVLAFTVLLLFLPGSLLLYVAGVLAVTTAQDFHALLHSRRQLSRALLRAS